MTELEKAIDDIQHSVFCFARQAGKTTFSKALKVILDHLTGVCEWKWVDSCQKVIVLYAGHYETECGNELAHYDLLARDKALYCPFCGKKIKEIK